MAFSVNCRALPVFVGDLAFSPSVTVTSPKCSVFIWGWNALKPTLKVSFLFLLPWGRFKLSLSIDAISVFSIFLSGMSSVGFCMLGLGLLHFHLIISWKILPWFGTSNYAFFFDASFDMLRGF
jgi:hypothetical protein